MSNDPVVHLAGARGEDIARRAEELLGGEPDRGDANPDEAYFDKYFDLLRSIAELLPVGSYLRGQALPRQETRNDDDEHGV